MGRSLGTAPRATLDNPTHDDIVNAFLPILCLLAVACMPGVENRGQADAYRDDPPADSGPPDTSQQRDTGTEQVGDNGNEELDPAAWIFTLDRVHSIDIELGSEALKELQSWPSYYSWDLPHDYVEGAVTFDGERLEGVGVRLKGKASYRGLDGKASFKIDLNRFAEGQDLDGLKKLTLNNMVSDYSQLHEHLAYEIHNAVGIRSPRTAYAWVTLNGVIYGLYVLLETPDCVFVDGLDDPGGNLYDGDYYVYSDGSYNTVDFVEERQVFDLDCGEDVGMADLQLVTDALATTTGSAEFWDTTTPLVDWDHHLAMWAVEYWVGQTDGYSGNSNNYRVYFPPDGGPLRMVPWGHDWAFSFAYDWHTTVRGQLSAACLQDASCTARHAEVFDQTWLAIDELSLQDWFDEAQALVQPYVEADPRREVDLDTNAIYQGFILQWFEGRAGAVRGHWGIDP